MIKDIRECILVLFFILLLPILVPYSLLMDRVEKRRLRQLASRFVCEQCGEVLGVEAIRLADERWDEMELQMMRIEEPVARVVRSRLLDAICPHCGCQYLYHKMEQTFMKRSEVVGQDPADAEMKDRWYRI
ncbi:hypothetical protein FYZ48_10190 [Gimesia chilikensis]|uniref:hypothetical protein n=1 Tax=Gimesia chilikensis TaxID=2605989 RepID=UPI0011EDD307|nr:hypothetical protein [Gimesia chilikensis]KAA0139020.1 hypothetical protein FYZ48_10190 [Gimesia chilikensis]